MTEACGCSETASLRQEIEELKKRVAALEEDLKMSLSILEDERQRNCEHYSWDYTDEVRGVQHRECEQCGRKEHIERPHPEFVKCRCDSQLIRNVG